MATSESLGSGPPGPKSFYLRNILRGVRDPLGFVTSMVERYGEFVVLREGRTFIAAAPDGVQRVLQENHTNYEKGPLYRRALLPLMGHGVFTAEGEAWKRQRRVAQPAFSKRVHGFFAQVIVEHFTEMRARWMTAAREARPVDLQKEMMSMTLRIAFRIAFSESVGAGQVDELVKAFLACEHEMNIARAFWPVHLPKWAPTPSAVRFGRGMRMLDEFVYGAIRARRERREAPDDVLGMYMNATFEENGGRLDDIALRDEMMTVLAAGHETVADGICWMFYLLTQHPETVKRIEEETRRALGGRLPTLADLESLDYITMTIKEGLRLYPPAWGFLRTALDEDVICGYRIPAGARIVVCPYLTHRLPSIWENPERFEPERFSPARSEGRHRFAWFPFGEGPRKCIGMGLALLESQLLLPMVYQAFEVEAVPGPPIRPVPRVSLKQNRALELKLTARRGALGGT